MKSIYVVTVNSDQIEGRGTQIPFAFFESEDDAMSCKKNSKKIDCQYKEIMLFTSYDEYVKNSAMINTRSTIMSKLTKDEIQFLKIHGLNVAT